MTISTMVSSIHAAWAASASASSASAVRTVSSPAISASARLAFADACTAAALARHRGRIDWSIRAQVILSTHTSIDLPDCQRVAQCSTKSAAILSSRSSAVMTS